MKSDGGLVFWNLYCHLFTLTSEEPRNQRGGVTRPGPFSKRPLPGSILTSKQTK